MLILFETVAFVILIMCFIQYNKKKKYKRLFEIWLTLTSVAIIALLILTIIIGVNVIKVSTESFIDKKIEFYESENDEILERLDKTIEKFLHQEENQKYENLKGEDPLIVITLIDDLKFDSMVGWQASQYRKNMDHINELKEYKIDIAKTRWVLYFKK